MSQNLSHPFVNTKVITAEPDSLAEYLRKVYEHRNMILTIARRDLKVKYAQTALGVFWAVLQPITGMVIFSLFFTNIFNLEDFGIYVPYYLFAFAGLSAWLYFTYIVQGAGTSLLSEENLVKKVYFPRIVLPLAKTLVGFVDFGITILLLIAMAAVTGNLYPANLIALPLVILVVTFIGFSLAIWLSALTIRYRDFHHLIPYIVNFGIWLTPVFYPATIIPQKIYYLIYLNPMAGAVDFFRWSVMGTPLPSAYFLVSFAVVFLLLVSGLIYFRRVEDLIADHL